MTGFGEAHRQAGGVAAAVEARTFNSKYFKLSVRCAEGYNSLEPEIEQLVRQHVKRGTIQLSLRVDRPRSADDYRINTAVLGGYRQQLESIYETWRISQNVELGRLLLLPGVVDESSADNARAADDWPLIRDTIQAALENLSQMRADEGRAMAADLRLNADLVAAELTHIEARAPQVSDAYRGRLEERLKSVLAEYQVTLQPGDLIREIGLFSERSDISEEIVRLRSHLEQFATFLAAEESAGRKLEFLTQEMFREVNTIGSKASDVQISRHAIEIKAAIEKIREMIQNVE